MKEYKLWYCGVGCGAAFAYAIIGDYVSAGVSALVAAFAFFSWRAIKW